MGQLGETLFFQGFGVIESRPLSLSCAQGAELKLQKNENSGFLVSQFWTNQTSTISNKKVGLSSRGSVRGAGCWSFFA